jgi:peptidoglycan hydrolase CwlO-like protein
MQQDLKSLFQSYGLDEKSVDFLTKALERNNQPGFDYLEYKQSLVALAKMNMDEATAFKSAFATAATMGLTKDKLLSAADFYKGVLNSEKQQFDKALQNQLQNNVHSKQEEVKKLQVQIEEHRAQIKELEAQIVKNQGVIDRADEDIRSSKEKIETTRELFETTLRGILGDIDKDMNNIKQYL